MKKLLILFLLLIVGCGEQKPPVKKPEPPQPPIEVLPKEAHDFKDLGNGWWQFSFKGKVFMYKSASHGVGRRGYGYSSITEISISEDL